VNVTATHLPEVKVIEPDVIRDERGFFFESYNRRDLANTVGVTDEFVQDNHSRSSRGVLRGLHYQIEQSQSKLVRVLNGRIFDVCVDIRRSSPRFGQWVGIELSAETASMTWVPTGFAHGFLVLSETADVLYKTTDYYAPQHARSILWNDEQINIAWPDVGPPILSPKDAQAPSLTQADLFD
jgi:dTDP-4-dehydrorhamnose 3,5-epimerase